jgi:hypothetical protein
MASSNDEVTGSGVGDPDVTPSDSGSDSASSSSAASDSGCGFCCSLSRYSVSAYAVEYLSYIASATAEKTVRSSSLSQGITTSARCSFATLQIPTSTSIVNTVSRQAAFGESRKLCEDGDGRVRSGLSSKRSSGKTTHCEEGSWQGSIYRSQQGVNLLTGWCCCRECTDN